MYKLNTKYIIIVLSFIVITIGCTGPLPNGIPSKYYHKINWETNNLHGKEFTVNNTNCESCHGMDLKGGQSNISCIDCHHEIKGHLQVSDAPAKHF